MKKIKQITTVLLSLLMILTLFVGCGNSDDHEAYEEDGTESDFVYEDGAEDSEQNNSDDPTAPTKPTVSGPTIPDPDAYFNYQLARNEDMYIEEHGYHCLSFKTDYDGQQAMLDYAALLSQGDFNLEPTTQQEETIYYLHEYRYAFTYTGSGDVPSIYNESNDISGDLIVIIQKNGQAGTVLLTMYFKPDVFAFVDFGDRTSYTLVDYSGNSSSNSGSDSNSGSGSEFTTKSNFDCFDCNGTGDCQECGGDGYVWSSATDSERRDCNKCMFNKGKCNTCKGSGRR